MNQAVFSMGGEALARSHRESDNNYHSVVAILNSQWRVIECRDGIQWIIQCSKKTWHGTQWRGRSYCRTRNVLIRLCAQLKPEIDPISLQVLERLPRITGMEA